MMDFFAKTDKGQRRRMNQDYVFASDQPVGALPNLFLLADGMGGPMNATSGSTAWHSRIRI